MSQTTPAAVQQVMNDLPPGSVLREQLEHGTDGNGIEKPYMEEMRSQGVKRAYFEVHSIWRGNQPAELQVVHRLYFDEFDGANSQIVVPAKLAELEQSKLQGDLDRIARERVLQAHLFLGIEYRPNPEGKTMYSYIELLANPWLPEERVLVSPIGKFPPALLHAAMMGDQLTVKAQIQGRKLRPRELNRALFWAVNNPHDNSAVIKALIDAGADVNVRGSDGITPLINAVAHPCNVRGLLQEGADPSTRDKWGRDALGVARELKQLNSARLLEEAAAVKSSSADGH